MTPLGAITSPSCPCCSPSCRQRVQKTSEKHNPLANIVQDSPQDAQTPLPSLPKVPKTKENLRFFNVFRFPTHLLKSSKNAPRTAPEAPKLSSKCPSCRYHAPSWHFHDPSWAIMSPSSSCCSPSCRQHVQKTSEKHNPRANIVQDSPQDAQTPLPSL